MSNSWTLSYIVSRGKPSLHGIEMGEGEAHHRAKLNIYTFLLESHNYDDEKL